MYCINLTILVTAIEEGLELSMTLIAAPATAEPVVPAIAALVICWMCLISSSFSLRIQVFSISENNRVGW